MLRSLGSRVYILVLLMLLPSSACQKRPRPPAGESGAQESYRRPGELVAALGLRAGETVAEVGAGGGYLTLRLAVAVGAPGHVVATDVDGEALRSLRGRAEQLPATAAAIETRQVTAAEPGLEAGLYDLILLAQVDHLLPSRREFLRKLRPALRPGGRIALSNSERYEDVARREVIAAGFQVERSDVSLPAQFLIFLRP